jgi:predicted DNA-binding transcriptional regulator AlpA
LAAKIQSLFLHARQLAKCSKQELLPGDAGRLKWQKVGAAKAGQPFFICAGQLSKENSFARTPAMEITTVRLQQQLPETGYLRLVQIIGRKEDLKAKRPKSEIPALIPVSKSTWWAGVASGRYPKPVRIGPRITGWKIEDIRSLIARLSSSTEG